MTTYILTGALNPDQDLTNESTRKTCTKFAAFLRSKGYANYEVRTGYRAYDNVWQILVVLPGPLAEMPNLMALNDVHDLFSTYVLGDTTRFRWVEGLSDCNGIMPGWEDWANHGMLEYETRLSWDSRLGETY